jgi:hypothetical protein
MVTHPLSQFLKMLLKEEEKTLCRYFVIRSNKLGRTVRHEEGFLNTGIQKMTQLGR